MKVFENKIINYRKSQTGNISPQSLESQLKCQEEYFEETEEWSIKQGIIAIISLKNIC